jgi:adenylylsulfate kinase
LTAPDEGFVVLFTGPSGSGKSTLARALEEELSGRGCRVEVLDWEVTRRHLIPDLDLGFKKRHHRMRVQRMGFVSQMLSRNGVVAIVADIAPLRKTRDEVREICGGRFVEIYTHCASNAKLAWRLTVREWGRTRQGIPPYPFHWTFRYEKPLAPEVDLETDRHSLEECLATVVAWLVDQGYIAGGETS